MVPRPLPRKAPPRPAPEKTTAKAADRKKASKAPAGKALPAEERNARRLAGTRAAAGELARRLADVEKAREAVKEALQRDARANLERVRKAVSALEEVVSSRPLIEPRRLERDLAVLVDSCQGAKSRGARGRKRDLFAVDDLLGESARVLESSLASSAAANLKLLSEKVGELEAAREALLGAIDDRFRLRLRSSREALSLLEGAAPRLKPADLSRVSEELDRALTVARTVPLPRLGGKRKDLFRLDSFVKQAARRLGSVRKLLEARSEDADG